MCHYYCSVLLHVAFHRCRQTGFYTLAFLKWSLIYVYVGNGQSCILGCSIHPIHSFSVQVLFSRVLFYDISRVVFTLTAPSMIFVLYFHFIPLLAETLTVNCQWLSRCSHCTFVEMTLLYPHTSGCKSFHNISPISCSDFHISPSFLSFFLLCKSGNMVESNEYIIRSN